MIVAARSWTSTVTPTRLVSRSFASPSRRPRTVCFQTRSSDGAPGSTRKRGSSEQEMLLLCGVGYWVQGFRCFPWLALNFGMTHGLALSPATLQLVQSSANLPMAAKPLYGVLSDSLAIDGARRIPYISIGVVLQILAWGSLAAMPGAARSVLALVALVLLGSLGAAVAEVASDALVVECGSNQGLTGLQSYATMASAAGAILGNLLAGFCLTRAPPRAAFLIFTLILATQLGFAVRTRETGSGRSGSENFRARFSGIGDGSISRPLGWVVASIALVPSLSGSVFCYQTRCLNLEPSVVGMSRVVGQLVLLSGTMVYNRFGRRVPMRNLVQAVQILYAGSVLLDLVLLKQINLKIGISNPTFALVFSGLTEAVAQFKLLPFSVLFSGLCPQGCEASLTSFLASALCLASIVSGVLGFGLCHALRITSRDYSNLPAAVFVQFLVALVPLSFIQNLPAVRPETGPERI